MKKDVSDCKDVSFLQTSYCAVNDIMVEKSLKKH